MTFTMTFNDGDFLEQIENIKRDESLCLITNKEKAFISKEKLEEKGFESQSNSDEKNCYEITVNEKSFKTSDFKTKSDGSIEFTANDGTIIRASEYEIKKLN